MEEVLGWDKIAFRWIETGAVSTYGRLANPRARAKRGYMLYVTYQVHSDVLAPIRLAAEFFRGVLTQPWPLIKDAPLVRGAAEAMELLSNAGMSHDRPDFGIRLPKKNAF